MRLSIYLTLAGAVLAGIGGTLPTLGQEATAVSSGARLLTVKDIRPGMKGVGKTVFSGDRVEEFQVEILGVIENAGPKQNIILGRLSGGPLAQTGVMQGMSGSPVYVDGRLVGAVAMAFPFSKEPIAGIRPIEEMLQPEPQAKPLAGRIALNDRSLTAKVQPASALKFNDARLIDIATPVSFNGFTRNTVEQFAPQLRVLGFEPQQGLSGGKSPTAAQSAAPVQPGSMISVQLLTGDMNAGADGTVTHVDGNRVYAFGHRFLAAGPSEMPFAKASVLALLPNLSASFKISASGEPVGSITRDYNAAIAGELGKRPKMVPLSIEIRDPGRQFQYKMEMVNDRLLSPLLLQMAMYSALDATERTLGTSTVSLRGSVEFENGVPPVRIENVYSGDFNVPLVASLATALPVAYALQNNLDDLTLKNISLVLEPTPDKRQMHIDQVWTSRREVRPGETVQVFAQFAGDGGKEVTRSIDYTVPIGARVGPLYFSVADGSTINVTDARVYTLSEARPSAQLISLINGLRPNNKAYVRIWRSDQAYSVQGEDLPDPPPSLAMILSRTQLNPQQLARNSKIADMEINVGNVVVTGSKTVRVDVKE